MYEKFEVEFHKNDLAAYVLHIDQPPALELIIQYLEISNYYKIHLKFFSDNNSIRNISSIICIIKFVQLNRENRCEVWTRVLGVAVLGESGVICLEGRIERDVTCKTTAQLDRVDLGSHFDSHTALKIYWL